MLAIVIHFSREVSVFNALSLSSYVKATMTALYPPFYSLTNLNKNSLMDKSTSLDYIYSSGCFYLTSDGHLAMVSIGFHNWDIYCVNIKLCAPSKALSKET